jgi:hypothetical protein
MQRPAPLRTVLSALALGVAAAVVASPAEAKEEWFEPASLGMGGAVRTLGGDITAMRVNPAAMGSRATYLTGVSYSFYGRERTHVFSTGAYDSKSSAFALGSTYSVHISTPPWNPSTDLKWYQPDSELADTRTTHRWEVGAAYSLLERRINFGLGVRIMRHNYALRQDTMRVTMDTGITLFPFQFLGIGVSLANFIPTKDERYPVRFSSGIAVVIPEILDIGVDAVFDLTSAEKVKVDVHGGLTFRALQLLLIRAGYYGDRGFTDNYVTWGLGLKIPTAKVTFNVDYAMRVEVGPMDGALRDDRKEGFQRIYNSIGAALSF